MAVDMGVGVAMRMGVGFSRVCGRAARALWRGNGRREAAQWRGRVAAVETEAEAQAAAWVWRLTRILTRSGLQRPRQVISSSTVSICKQ